METTLHETTSSPMTHNGYTIAWICALPKELTAARAMLDETHPDLPQPQTDPNTYCLGSIGSHNLVITSLPKGEIGNNSSAAVASHLLATFPQVRFGLMVGIGGGVPSEDHDIRLGDVVVSSAVGTHGGVVQWDFGKMTQGGQFERTGALHTSPRVLRTAVVKLESAHQMSDSSVPDYIKDMVRRYPKLRRFAERAGLDDVLFNADYPHVDDDGGSCSRCDLTRTVNRAPREEDFVVHYGAIASGNKVVKDGATRDQISRDLGGVLCFEMEAAGLMNEFPCLVIRGICDYADSHKNKRWQEYSAVTAAAFAKELINCIPLSQVVDTQTANAVMEELLGEVVQTTQRVESKVLGAEEERILAWLSSIKISSMYLDAKSRRAQGTGDWLLESDEFARWKSSAGQLLWLFGVAGCGKTCLSSRVIEALEQQQQIDPNTSFAYWYFRFDDAVTLSLSNIIRAFVRQLTPFPLPASVRKLWDQHRSRAVEPDDKMLIEVLDTIISGLGEVYIVIDALDECPRDLGRHKEREALFGCIKRLMQRHGERVHMLVTSRPEPDIHDELVAYTGLDIEVNIKRDVQTFVENTLQGNRWLSGWTDAIKMEIREKLLSITDSRFLWTDLQLERLKECHTHDQIREYLRTMPQSLEDTYRKTLNYIPRKDISIARRILIWLTTSLRPLTLNELAAAVDLVRPESVLRICTSTLVTLVYEGSADETDAAHQIVKLSHFSVREFLVSCEEGWYHFSTASAHAALAEQALNSLLATRDLDITDELLPTRPILQYSAVFWYGHFRALQPEGEEYSDVTRLVGLLFSPHSSRVYLNWLRLHNCDAPVPTDCDYSLTLDSVPEPVYYASLLGFDAAVERLVEVGANVMTRGRMYRSPLVAASVQGFPETVKQLLKAVADIEIPDASQIVAKMSGRNIAKTIGVLLERPGLFPLTQEVFKAALQNERCGPEVLKSLMGHKETEVTITGEMVRTAAGNWGCGRELTMMLLDYYGTIPTTEDVLMAAVENELCGKEVISTLVDRCSPHMTITEALVESAAGNKRNRDVISVLLGRDGAEPEVTEGAMIQVARRFDKEVILALLRRATAKLPLCHDVVYDMMKVSPRTVVVSLLSHHGNWITITDEILSEIDRRFDQEVLDILLQQDRDDAPVTEKILKVVVGNDLGDALLAQQQESQISLACRNWRSGETIVQAILGYQKTGILLSKDVVIAAAENSRSGSRVMKALINHHRVDTRVQEDAVAEIVRRLDSDVIENLFDERPDIELTEAVLVAAACNEQYEGNLVQFMLQAEGSKPSITEAVIKAAINNQRKGVRLLAWLLQQTISPTSKSLVGGIVGDNGCPSSVMALLLNQPQNMIILGDIIREIVELHDESVITHLLHAPEVPIEMIPVIKEMVRAAEESKESVDRAVKDGLDQGARNTEVHTMAAMEDQSTDQDSATIHELDDPSEDLLQDEETDTEDIDLSNCRISSVDSCRLHRFRRLKALSLLHNQIGDDVFPQIPSILKSLDLSDNLISCIKDTSHLTSIRYLNLELNKIKHIKGLAHMTQLTDLYLGRNKISRIQNLDTLGHLRHLDLSNNRIRSLESLDNLHLLQELYLDNNKITDIKNIDGLVSLRILSLQSTRLTSISGLSRLLHLEELYLAGNNITKISGLGSCLNLRLLDIRGNDVSCLENLTGLQNLEELWASDNRLSSVEEVEVQLRDKKCLRSIEFKGNPLATAGSRELWLALPQVLFIDGGSRPVGFRK